MSAKVTAAASSRTMGAMVEFAPTTSPIASVVVLAWKLSTPLVACLRSLRASEIDGEFEVVIVLNGANAATRSAVAQRVRGAKVVDLEANVGYGGGCNAGALVATGKYIVLLNDDTLVERTWLSTLVTAAETAPPGIGAVASLLMNPDGTVQEAGSRVLRNAGTMAFGRGLTLAQAQHSGFLSRRPIDYGSGAALLMLRQTFVDVGGFDPLFEPAYFEDVDLCFRIRRAGFDVVLEPSAIVTHISGGSTEGDRRFRDFAFERSRSKFSSRWATVLAHAPKAGAPVESLCDPQLIAEVPILVDRKSPDRIRPNTVALAIAQDYQAWLNERLDRIEANAELVTRRLADLENRGPIGILRWRVGLWLQRRREARSA
ncbi:MAG: glycosyltransferase family 2 protein [Salinibacterium sp.]|nr:MAG: glycosyltransferase family 2 protein [Salinibacterium sp.]